MSTPKTTKVLKYVDLISKSAKDLEKEELELKVQESKSALEIDIATTNRDLALARKQLVQAQCACPYSLQAEIDAMSQVSELEAGVEFAKRVLAERF